MSDILTVPRAGFDIEDPWHFPSVCAPVRLRRAMDGQPPRLATSVAAYWDDELLSVLFSAADDHIAATHLEHDAPLWKEDAVEFFFAPRELTEYFELEVNPLATTFDARIESPQGIRATMVVDLAWECRGLFACVRKVIEPDGSMTVDTLMRIPFASIGGRPAEGDRWRGNFFRIDRHPSAGAEFSAWQPTMKSPPDFHVAAVFGTLVFGR